MTSYRSDRLFTWLNNALIVFVSLTMVSPIIHIAAISFSSPYYANANLVSFWPKGFNTEVYDVIFGMKAMWRSMAVTIYITAAGTFIALFFTATMAYALSRPRMPAKRLILQATIVSFIFSIPLIPGYLVVRGTGLENTLWALMVPGALGTFNILIMRTFFKGISVELLEAAQIDGCSELGLFGRMAIPLSMPVVATIALFHAVSQWNSYFSAIIYIRSRELYPLQVLLRSLVVDIDGSGTRSLEVSAVTTAETMKAGIIIFATVPILIVYPFLQKYFVKGAMLGSLKE